MPDGSVYSAREMAREQAEKIKTGGVVAFPSVRDERGNYQWEWIPPQIQGNASEIREYPRDLDNEITRGLGIPDNVLVDAPGTGSYAGRKVPERAFYVGLEQIVAELMLALRVQLIDPLLKLNFEGSHEYEIITKPLIEIMSPEGSLPAGGMEAVGAGATLGGVFSTDDMTTGNTPLPASSPTLGGA